ncbi:hypothetical protein Anapl_13869 [Anas platyrhynchos]|uniref:Uncharacterized protein n=1 Tax=Anas platyrhynchos TaxID=8839 RepID=R0JDV5_ANAPL|nr:hypothetical protein Anapl_13869 [Anas platyrhynchos]
MRITGKNCRSCSAAPFCFIERRRLHWENALFGYGAARISQGSFVRAKPQCEEPAPVSAPTTRATPQPVPGGPRAASVGRSGWWASSRLASCATPQGPAGSESGIPVVPLEIPIVCNLSVCNLSGDDSGSAAANREGHARSFLYTYTELSAAWIDFQAKQAC